MTLRHLPPTLLLVPATLLIGLTAISCSSDDSTGNTGIGTLTLSVACEPSLLLPSGEPSGEICSVQPETTDISITMSDINGTYKHTWESFDRFPQQESYYAGAYTLSLSAGNPADEGFDRPAYAGKGETTVTVGERTDASVTLTPASAFLTVNFDESFTLAYPSAHAIAHSEGGEYHTFDQSEKRMLCLLPSPTELFISLGGGEEPATSFRIFDLGTTVAATLYNVDISADTSGEYPVVKVTAAGRTESYTLTPDFLSLTPPCVTLSISDTRFTLPEGDSPDSPVTATVSSDGSNIDHIYLSTRSESLALHGVPAEADLLNLSPRHKEILDSLQLSITTTADGVEIDFTSFLGNLVYLTPENAESAFSLMAIDSRGLVSSPTTISVVTTPVEIEVMESTPAVMCEDRSKVVVKCDAPGFEHHVDIEVEQAVGRWVRTNFDITHIGENLYELSFDIPEGSAPAGARVLYCEEVRSTFSIPRILPDYTVSIDGFAKTAALRISSADPQLTTKITERVNVYINGTPMPVYQRMPSKGVVTVIGLSPSTSYTLKTTLMDGVEQPLFTPETRFSTEGTPQLTNGDFEERKKGPQASEMPSGGVYAQTSVDIFNCQHHTSFSCEVPKNWATTNEKTFNLSSSNINTWYLQPSAHLVRDDASGGTFSVLLTSVAFDPSGEDIPPYAQTGKPYLDYSPIVPEIKYRAAGKLFLGEYSYNPASGVEIYKEGLSWSSRPYSLSGAYKFLPCAADRNDAGLVTVEVLGNVDGKEVTIASERLTLPYAASFTAFNVPISYEMFGVKATRIKVMFASSAHTGTIEEETLLVGTVSDPVTASSTGGRLWIDDIRLAY